MRISTRLVITVNELSSLAPLVPLTRRTTGSISTVSAMQLNIASIPLSTSWMMTTFLRIYQPIAVTPMMQIHVISRRKRPIATWWGDCLADCLPMSFNRPSRTPLRCSECHLVKSSSVSSIHHVLLQMFLIPMNQLLQTSYFVTPHTPIRVLQLRNCLLDNPNIKSWFCK